ncbi:Ig-like domain-containing protein [Amphritea sp. HPY]|uniref:Ig-like domain-containing protein n=1 Tax=Amphritea sp. HPY TaxID=3421652 RepID=UPI003D7CBC35
MSQLRPRFASTLATLSLSAAVALASANAVAQQPEHAHSADHSAGHGQQVAATNPAAQRKAAIDSTEALINSHKQWAQARGAANKAAALQNLIAKTEARRELMAELIKTNPAEALRVAIPGEKQSGMPAEVQAMLEQKMEIEGELEVVYEDYEDGSHKLKHFLKTSFGERFALHFSGKKPVHNSGKLVSASGVMLENNDADNLSEDGDLVLGSEEDALLTLADGGTGNGGSAGLPNALGDQHTLVILVNFQDKPSEKPWTVAEAQNMVFGTVNDFYAENSSQQTSISGDVYGWYTLPLSSTSCDGFAIQDQAKAAAQAAGADLSSYDRFVFAFPKNGCGYSGMGQVGAYPSSTWINNSLTLRTVAHELGHNLGLHHSHAKDCGDTTLGNSCSSQEYGDTLDILGYSGTVGHFNAFQKERLGWLSSTELVNADASGSYTLSPYAQTGNTPKALKALKSTDPVTGNRTWYYIEYRQPVGFDSELVNRGIVDTNNVFNGVTVHIGTENEGNSSYLLDMTPGSEFIDMKDAALTVGNLFSDSSSNITIATDSANSSQAQVSLSGGSAPVCTRANPTISVTPGESPWVAAGTAVDYQVTVTNRDSSACSNSTYNLSSTGLSGWNSNFSNSALNLAPGNSSTAILTVTSSATAADGFYNFTVTANSNGYSANSAITYVVSNGSSNSLPVAISDSATTDANTPVTINVLGNDYDPDGDSLSLVSASGNTAVNSNGTITYTPANGFSGIDSFSYSITDGNGGNASGTVTVTVNAVNNNQAPVAVSDSATMPSKSAITIAVLGNDYDPEGDSLQVTAVTQGAKGSVQVNADGSLTYIPAKRFKSSDSFSYTISDGNKTATATVSVQLQSSGDTGGSGGGKGNGKKNQ